MANTLTERTVTAVALVEKAGEKITIPESMSVDQAILNLQRFKNAQEEVVVVNRDFDAFPWDGAVALHHVLADTFGWANAIPTPGFFGPNPPTMVTVEVGYKQTVSVPWGRLSLPNIQGGYVDTGIGTRHGRTVFKLMASVRRKFENEVKALYDKIAQRLEEHSIYRGKAVEIDFDCVDPDTGLFEPKFINTAGVTEDSLVLPVDLKATVDSEVFTPVKRIKELAKHGIDFRAVVLLAGKFGVGKTLTMTALAALCERLGIMFAKCKRVDQLDKLIPFVRMYQEPYGAVISGEDIDRVTSGERSVSLDDILNTIDGVDSKTSKIFAVFTTNAVEQINPAALRRVRHTIEFTEPDAKAAEKLIRHYGKGIVAEDTDLTEVSQLLADHKALPSVIADVVSSSKLAMLKLVPEGTKKLVVSNEALLESAKAKIRQVELINRDRSPKAMPTIDMALKGMVAGAVGELLSQITTDQKTLVVKDESYKYKTNGDKIKMIGS